jgi:two-component system chemotaxis sensor kinase CheA
MEPTALLVVDETISESGLFFAELAKKNIKATKVGDCAAARALFEQSKNIDFVFLGPNITNQDKLEFVNSSKSAGYKGLLVAMLSKNSTYDDVIELSKSYLHFIFDADDALVVSKKVTNLVSLFNIKAERLRMQELEKNIAEESAKLVEANVNNVVLLADVNKKNKLLDIAKRDIQTLLDNLGQGFLMLSAQGVIQDGFSKAAVEMFGCVLAGMRFGEVLGLDADNAAKVHEWIEMIFSEALPFDDIKPLGPKIFRRNNQYIELDYRPIRLAENDKIEKIIVIATDKTVEKALESKQKIEEAYSKMLLAVARDRDGFRNFYDETSRIFVEMNEAIVGTVDSATLAKLFRYAYSIKGNSSAYNLLTAKEAAHGLEDMLAKGAGDVEALRKAASELTGIFNTSIDDVKKAFGDDLVGGAVDRRVFVDAIDAVRKSLEQRFEKNSHEMRLFYDTFVHDNFADHWKRFEPKVTDTAKRMNKEVVFSVCSASPVMIQLERYKPLLQSAIHAFRNALDHGIESPEERESSGKSRIGSIKVKLDEHCKNDKHFVSIVIEDDGRGVDPERVKAVAVKKGMLAETAAAELKAHEIFQLLLAPGFSTKEEVSEWSGRGVGLDAMAAECRTLGGNIRIESVHGKGTSICMVVPLIKEIVWSY